MQMTRNQSTQETPTWISSPTDKTNGYGLTILQNTMVIYSRYKKCFNVESVEMHHKTQAQDNDIIKYIMRKLE